MANQITSQREENFEDPFKFWPERWLSNSSKEDVHFSYLPFGHGIRSCLGKNMAEAKMMLLTAKVYKYNQSSFDRDIILISFCSLYDNSELNTITLISKADL